MIDDLAAIKQHNPIQAVMARHGLVLRPSGRHLVGHCPFHRDDHPSLVVYPETQSFFCFGCRAGGDVIDFVGRANGLSFREALDRLRGDALPARTGPERPRLSPEDRRLLTAACGLYHARLLEASKALRYLEERGIDVPTIQACRLGYSDGRSLLPALYRRRLGVRRAQALGLLSRGNGETLSGRIIIPELRTGQCTWMIGRMLSDDRQPRYRGLALPKPLLGYERVRGHTWAVVTEGPFDYLTGVRWGLPICAVLGTHVRAGPLAFLEQAERVFIAFDRDQPGQEAAAELAGRLGPRAHVLALPESVKDLNDLGRRADGWEILVRLIHEAERRHGVEGEPQPEAGDVVQTP